MDEPGGVIGQSINGNPCGGPNSTVAFASVRVSGDIEGVSVVLSWTGFEPGQTTLQPDGDTFYGQVGPVGYSGKPNEGGSLDVAAVATDRSGRRATLPATVNVAGCSATAASTNVS